MRSVVSKVVWVGRATVFPVVVAVMLVVVFGVSSPASAHSGYKGLLHLGHKNVASAVSILVKKGAGPALDLRVASGPPLAVNSKARVANLNADRIDGKDSKQFVHGTGALASLVHKTTRRNVKGACTYISHSAANGDPDARLWVTHVYNGGYHNAPLGVYYDTGTRKWCVFTEDKSAMPTGLSFNVLVWS